MKSYQPSNKVPLGGVILLILSTLIGLLVGKSIFAASRSIEVGIIYPIIIGAIGTGIISLTVKAGKVRNPVLASFFGFIFGILAYGGTHYFRYLAWPQADQHNIFEYLALRAREGMVIRVRDGRLVSLSPFFTWVYWFLELAIASGSPMVGGFICARQPFSEQRNQWYGKGKYLGSISVDQIEEFKRLVQIGDFVRVGAMLTEDMAFPNISIYLQAWENDPADDAFFSANRLSARTKGDVVHQPILSGLISPAQVSELMQGISAGKMKT